MSQPYRICHNCGASLTPDQAYCPRCGAQYVAPIVQQPVVPPPPQPQAPYPPQGQGYTPSPYSPASYGQQTPMTPVAGQMGDSPQPPSSQTGRGVSPFLLIGMVVVILLLFVGVGSLLYTLGQQNGSKPGTTPTPGITPTPTPTPGTTPRPTPTPRITPTATALQASDSGRTVMLLSMHDVSRLSDPKTGANTSRDPPITYLYESRRRVFPPEVVIHGNANYVQEQRM